MSSSFRRPLFALAACILLVVVTSWHASSAKPNSVHPYIITASLSVKPKNPSLPRRTAKVPPKVPKVFPVIDRIAPLPLPEPLYWHGPIEPVAIAPGSVPVISRVPTAKPVVFLGIDDGWYQTPDALNWLTSHKLPFTMFLENNAIKNNYGYFFRLQKAGLSIQDHTLTHPDLIKLPLSGQETEICGAADTFASVFGRRPTLFRPPYGAFNSLTVVAAGVCGMKAVVMWHAKVSDGAVQFQDNDTSFLPGDIILMHFRPEFAADIQAFIKEVEKDHLQVARLEDWLQ